MKSKLSELYKNKWFNLIVVCLATIGGLTQSFLAIIIPMAYLIGGGITSTLSTK